MIKDILYQLKAMLLALVFSIPYYFGMQHIVNMAGDQLTFPMAATIITVSTLIWAPICAVLVSLVMFRRKKK